MKSIIKMLVYAMFMSCIAILSACSKEPLLSCDPVINKWARENLPHYENADREELLELSLSEQRAIIIGLSGAKRVQLWNEKLKIVKDQNILPEEELCIYEDIINALQPIHFEDPDKSMEFLVFVEQKLEILYNKHISGMNKKNFIFYTRG